MSTNGGGVLRLGDTAPDFTASCFFPEDETKTEVHFADYCRGHWVVLFSHPADFTPVCTTELARVAVLHREWQRRGCRVIGLSTDSIAQHRAWATDISQYIAITTDCAIDDRPGVNFPIIADEDLQVSRLFGMLDQETHDPTNVNATSRAPLPIRTVFILDPARRVRLTLTYPAAIGRNFDEILRTLDGLQRSDGHRIATPADWTPGQEVIVRFDVDAEEASRLFPNHRAVTSYLRFTSDPVADFKSGH